MRVINLKEKYPTFKKNEPMLHKEGTILPNVEILKFNRWT